MFCRTITLSVFAFTLLAINAVSCAADAPKGVSHDGIVVSMTSEKLVMTARGSKDLKQHSHIVAVETKLVLDGKPCKAEDIKPGMKIRVTTRKGDAKSLIQIEAINKQKTFANTHDGKVISIDGKSLVMTGATGKDEHTCTLTDDVVVTCDGVACKPSDLKPGMKVRVTTEHQSPHTATHVEALDKNPEFASL